MTEALGRTIGERIAADYVVMVVALVCWIAVFLYLVRLEKKVKELEKS